METFNGWRNYGTWCVYSWLMNDESTYNDVLQMVEAARDSSTFFKDQCNALTDKIKDYTCDEARRLDASMYSDLLQWALELVSFYDIAKSLLEDEEKAK